jgi:DNA-binding transcriptional LysR family regulator
VAGHEETHGSITIRVPQSISVYLLPPVIKAFMARFPKVGLDIGSCAQTIQQELRSGIIDLAFLLADHTVLLPKQDCSYKMLFQKLLAEERVACASIMEFNRVEAIKHTFRTPQDEWE